MGINDGSNDHVELAKTLYATDYCEKEWIYVEYIRRLLSLSPHIMCNILNDGSFYFEDANECVSINTNFDHLAKGKTNFFTIDNLDEVKIHKKTWRHFLNVLGYEYFTPLNINPKSATHVSVDDDSDVVEYMIDNVDIYGKESAQETRGLQQQHGSISNINLAPCLNCKHLSEFKDTIFEELAKCKGVFEYEFDRAVSKSSIDIEKIEIEFNERAESINRLLAVMQGYIPTHQMKTASAINARQEKNLESWQASFKVMISVILQCHADGPKKRTKAELQHMCSKHGGEITSTQREFLRKCLRECLGEEHVNTDGGPSSQG